MLIHVVTYSLTPDCPTPLAGIRAAAEQLGRAGADVVTDFAAGTGDLSEAVAEFAETLLARWEQQTVDVVHCVGLVATLAALAARPAGLPVVATLVENDIPQAVEKSLARDVDVIVPLSDGEQQRWRHLGAATLSPGAVVVAEQMSERPGNGGAVVCLSDGPGLETVIDSMVHWNPSPLVLLGNLPGSVKVAVTERARALGVADRIEFRPGLSGAQREAVWQQADLLIACTDGSRHAGQVIEAAAHAVPAIALAEGAHVDHIVPGATGVLVDPQDGARGLGLAVSMLLKDPLARRGLGAAAAVRVRAHHDRNAIGRRLLDIYRLVCGDVPVRTTTSTTPVLTAEGTRLALDHLTLARQLAHRYAGRGQRLEDLIQVASLGLVRAACRFDPELGTQFHSFAVPTILGELRRHFRDHAWAARVPRSLQEVTLKVQRVSDELRASNGQEPTPMQIADRLGLLEEEVLEAMQARGEAMSSKSLDHPMGEDGDEAFGDLVGDVDPDLDYVESREAVREALAQLPEREREILLMRFYGEQTQAEIAEQMGLSQVHVSRLITRTLAALRDYVLKDVPLPRSWSETESRPAVA